MALKDKPLKIIPYRPEDTPTVCIEVNVHWVPFLMAAVYPSRYPEAWLGTLEENKQARQDVLTLLRLFMEAIDCGMSSDCCPENLTIIVEHRLSPDNSTLEMSIDGGQTWVPDASDPRAQIMETPAPVNNSVATRCDAADNIVQGLKEAQVAISNTASGEGTLQEIALEVVVAILALMLLPPEGAILLTILVAGIVKRFLDMGKENYDALFTEERWDIVRCAFYCNLEDNGKLSANGLAATKRYIYQRIPGNNTPNGAAQNIVDVINFVGLAGLNLFGYTRQASGADCSDCECPDCVMDLDFESLPFYWLMSAVFGEWVGGQGWRSTYPRPGSNPRYYEAEVEYLFAKPCDAGTVFLHWFMDNPNDGLARAYFHYQYLEDDTLVWTDGYNISPNPGDHQESFVLGAPGIPVYGIRFGVVNIGQPAGHFIKEIRIPSA